jgi:hypothetical protein
MIVDLNPLPYRLAFDLLEYCIKHNIDLEQCSKLTEACKINSSEWNDDVVWEIDVPEDVLTYFMLKWM